MIIEVIIGSLVFLLVVFLAITIILANALTKPTRSIDKIKYNPGVYGLEYEEFTFPARQDGLKIAAWYIPSQENHRAIILVHGYNDSRTKAFLNQFVRFASELHAAGFSVMMIDLRGHGESADARFTLGIKERWDVLGAVDWLERRGYQPGKIGVLAYSLGAGSAIGAAAEEPDIGAVWADSLFTEIKTSLEAGVSSVYHMPKLLIRFGVAMVRILYGYDLLADHPIDEIGKIAPRPIFLAHCRCDRLIPVAQMEQLAAAAQNSQTWIIQNCDAHALSEPVADLPEIFNNHATGYALNPAEYAQRAIRFFDENLK